MENAQKEDMTYKADNRENMDFKTSEARRRANKKYANSRWRPNIFIDKDLQPEIEERIKDLGLESFNKYVLKLIQLDIEKGLLDWE